MALHHGGRGRRSHAPVAGPRQVGDVTQSSQQALYERIHDEYVRHHYDATSNAYRDAFNNCSLFEGLDLNGKSMAEIMCGNGQATLFAKSRFPGVHCQGFDISRRACEEYTQWTGFPATASDILTEPLPREAFDVIAVIGGLHHVIRGLDAAMTNVHAALRPGGTLMMMEPNSDYVLESIRKLGIARIAISTPMTSRRSVTRRCAPATARCSKSATFGTWAARAIS